MPRSQSPISGDGCCPPGATNATDNDCPPSCGNGVVERGETCDRGSCPTTCPLPPPDIVGRRGCLLNEVVGDPDRMRSALRVRARSTRATRTTRTAAVPTAARPRRTPIARSACGDGFIRADAGRRVRHRYSAGSARCLPDVVRRPQPLHGRLPGQRRHVRRALRSRPDHGLSSRRRLLPSAVARSMLDPDCPARCGNGIVERPAEICDFGVGRRLVPRAPGRVSRTTRAPPTP